LGKTLNHISPSIFTTDNHYLHVKPPQSSAIASDFEWRTLWAN